MRTDAILSGLSMCRFAIGLVVALLQTLCVGLELVAVGLYRCLRPPLSTLSVGLEFAAGTLWPAPGREAHTRPAGRGLPE